MCVAAKPEKKKPRGGVTVAVQTHTHTHSEKLSGRTAAAGQDSRFLPHATHYSSLLPGERRDGLNDRSPAWGVGLDTQGQTRSFRARSSAPPELYGSDFS